MRSNSHENKTQKHQSLVHLSAREPPIVNHNQEKTAAIAKPAEEEQADDQEGKKEQQQHLQNSLNTITPIESNPGDYKEPTIIDNARLVAANNHSRFKKLVKGFIFVLKFVSIVKQKKKPTEGKRITHPTHKVERTVTPSGNDIEEARLLILRTFQKQQLTEFEVLKQSKNLLGKSTLRALAPFSDEE